MMQYEKYKDSGIEWLGDIPEHWEMARISTKCDTLTGFPFKSRLYTNNPEHTKLVRGINVKEGVLNWKDTQYWETITPFLKKYFLQNGDLVIQMDGSKVGKNYAYITEEDLPLLLLQRVTRLRFNKENVPRYFYYHFASSAFFQWVTIRKSDPLVPHISLKDIECFYIPSPKLEEQKTIAKYLDTKTQAIDTKVSLLQKKIDYYTELRVSIINDAVTKGLDKNVELKGSEIGIDVPKHWIRYRLKDIGNLYSGLSGKSGDDFRQDEHEHNKGYIPFTNIAANTYIADDNLGTVVVEPTENQNQVRQGDVFFLMSSEGYEDIGKSSVLDKDLGETYLNSFCKGYRLKSDKYNPHFINYLLLSDSYRQLLIVEGKGFTRINLKMEKVSDFFIHIPPTKAEQTEIAQYLDKKTNTIDAIVTNIGKQIEHLTELRKTLINDVVTGKIKVFTGSLTDGNNEL